MPGSRAERRAKSSAQPAAHDAREFLFLLRCAIAALRALIGDVLAAFLKAPPAFALSLRGVVVALRRSRLLGRRLLLLGRCRCRRRLARAAIRRGTRRLLAL